MANRYERSQVIDYKPYLPPVEMYAKALEMKQQKFDAYRGVAEEMGSKYIDGLQQDSPRARQIESELQAKIDAEVAKVGGDYSKLAPALYKLKRDVNKMFGAGGEAYAIAQNKKNLMEAEKLEQARYKKGDIRADQLSA